VHIYIKYFIKPKTRVRSCFFDILLLPDSCIMEIIAQLLVLVVVPFLLNSGNGIETISTHSINYRATAKQPYRTSYHFQPQENWMNGIVITSKFCGSNFTISTLILLGLPVYLFNSVSFVEPLIVLILFFYHLTCFCGR